MGHMFRSEEMALTQLFIQPEAAYFIVSEMGESGCVQFRDLNADVNSLQRTFINEVRRCDEMERKLRYIQLELKKDGIELPEVVDLPKAPNPREIIDLEVHLEKTEGEIKELTDGMVTLKSNHLKLTELSQILEKTKSFFNEQQESAAHDAELSRRVSHGGCLNFVAGVVNREKVPGFERMLWRVSRGNVFLRQSEIKEPFEDPISRNEIYKTAFVAFFQGEQLKGRVEKICSGFHATLYPCSSRQEEREEMLKQLAPRLEDMKMVLNQTSDHRQRVLLSVAKELQNWIYMVSKMKAIYHTLNFFNMDVSKKCLIGEGWVPNRSISTVQKALADGSNACGSSIASFLNVIHTSEAPPTYYVTNKFTKGFQNLIDAYGIASYREANPALYTIITFPFLFAVMFGDVGHATIMILVGLWMVLSEKKIAAIKNKGEIFNIFFVGRYIILLMGLFSLYTGFVYNDIFSKSMNIFGSSWAKLNYTKSDINPTDESMITLNPSYHYKGTPYFIGMDPAWQNAKNKIIFLNSYKMKLSIIFGVAHMMFGVCVSTVNSLYFKKKSAIYLEFLPQILLLIFLFVYLVVMMFMKWIMYSADLSDLEYGSSCAPSVLIYFINMMLLKNAEKKDDCPDYMFSGQKNVQYAVLLGTVICIPVLLLGTPIHAMMQRKKKAKNTRTVSHNNDSNEILQFEVTPECNQEHEHEEEEEPISEIFIHQAIHTVEYVLSTISHTASYLRLWALSLAHAQLSEVLWSMILQKLALTMGGLGIGAAFLFLFFIPWSLFTIAILVLMEGLSAFLHTLRLHWVEFMSKFYIGLGYKFQPFSFKSILKAEEEEK